MIQFTKRQAMRAVSAMAAFVSVPVAGQGGSAPDGPEVTVDLRTTSGPVGRAVEDLAHDLARVLGTPPVRGRSSRTPDGLVIRIETVGGPPESFSLSRRGRTITLAGADMRGTIYAVYQFSQDGLGVDPMHFWTDAVPPRRAAIDMADGVDRRFPPPVFEHRGFFVNDEDQLTGWAPAAPGQQCNIAPAVMDKVYETLLRLKANMVVPSTWPFPDDLQIKAAGARGLIVNQHHATPVGMNAARWPKDAPYDFTSHPEVLGRAWRNAVDLYDRDQEILWTVGLRGLSDMPYAALDRSVAGSDEKLGAVIGRAIAEQMRIVRLRFPRARFVTNLWPEGAALVRGGHLRIPDDVIVAWPDQGWGLVRDDGQVSPGQGFYYHVAMLNGRANQLSEMVPVDRIQAEFGRFVRAGATRFVLVNVSDLRAVAMTAKLTMDLAWGGVDAGGGAHDDCRAWAARQFGARAGGPVADFYQRYFNAIPHAPAGNGYGDGMELGDQHYHDTARELMLRTMVRPPYYRSYGQTPKWREMQQDLDDGAPETWLDATVARERPICRSAGARWDALMRAARAIEPLVDAGRRDYFRYAVLTMTAINRNSCAMLACVCDAVSAVRAGRIVEARAAVGAALRQLDELDRYRAHATYGKWSNWWRGDWLTNVASTRRMLDTFGRWLIDPIGTSPLPIHDVDWHAYSHILRYQGNRTVDVG